MTAFQSLQIAFLLAIPVAAQSSPTIFPLVAPTSATNTEGAAATAFPFGSSLSRHVQYAYDGSSIGYAAPMRIGAIELRADGNTPGGSIAGSYNFSLTCSTAVHAPGALSTTFADNQGGDKIVVRSGPLAVLAPAVGQAPNEFSLRIPFSRTFEWDPRNGPLLLDFAYNAATPAFGAWDAEVSPGVVGGITADGSTAVRATAILTTAPVLRLVAVGDVTPAAFATIEGQTSTGFPWNRVAGSGMRTLNLYESAVMPAGRRLITALAWRTDAGSAFVGRSYDVRISMSTSPLTGATLSATFAANHGGDLTTVFDGILVAPASPASADLGQFDLFCELQRPFEYDATNGALAVDVQLRNSTGATGANFDVTAQQGLQVGRLSETTNPNAATGTSNQPGVALVMAIRSVPVPVIPSSLANAVNPSPANGTGFPWNSTACRTIAMLSAAEAGIAQPTFVRHLRFRPTGTVTTFGPCTYTCTIDLSNPTNTPATVSPTFDLNHGSNRQRAFDGQFSMPFGTRVANDPHFPIEVKLQHPILWDPVAHPYLTVDIVVTNRAGSGIAIETTSGLTTDDARVFGASASATTGTTQPLAFVMQIGGEAANGLATNYGTGCAGTNGVPSCIAVGLPSLPNRDFRIGVRRAAGNSLAILLLGLSTANLPLPGAPGCNILNGLEFGTLANVVTGPAGDASAGLSLPAQPGFDGVVLLAQWVVLDPLISPFTPVTSDGLSLTLRFF